MGVSIVDADGAPVGQILAGSPFSVVAEVRRRPGAPPRTLRLEIRDEAGLLVAEESLPLDHDGVPGVIVARFDVPEPPLRFGRFRVRAYLLGPDHELLSERAAAQTLVVYPDAADRGLVRLGGSWTSASNDGKR